MNAPPSQGAHVSLEVAALTNGRICLASAMEHGFVGPLDIPAEAFHPELQAVARFAREARENGAKEFADVLLFLIQSTAAGGDQDLLRAKIADVSEEVPHRPEDLRKSAAMVRQYDLAKRRQFLVWELNTPEGQELPRRAEIVRLLSEIEADTGRGKASLRERAYLLRFNPDDVCPPDELCMLIGDIPIAARGNITVIQGKSKVGKSAVVAAVLGAVQRGQHHNPGDTLCINWHGDSDGAIVHLDTEQSRADWHALVCRSVTRSSLSEVSGRLVSLPLVLFARSERLEILRQTLEHERGAKGGIDIVVIDGIADLCTSPNDEAEALELVSRIMAISQEFNTPVFCILHENPGSDQGKTRGHLGSELNRKAFANLRVDKDTETSLSTIYGTDMRKRDIPRDQGFCFGWDDEAGMHSFQGRAAGLKAAQAEEKAVTKCRAEWVPIFENTPSIGTKTVCPALTPKQAAEIERDISGTGNLTKEATMKKRMQRAESLGVLRKTGEGIWTLNPIGTIGT